MNLPWEHSTEFYERVERLNLHGLHFQHVELCQRRSWMHLHRISFAQWHPLVQKGVSMHSTSHVRDISTQGLQGLNPDRLDWKNRLVYEHKVTAGAPNAVELQTSFYATLLSIASEKIWGCAVHVYSTRKTRRFILDENILERLWRASEELENISALNKVPEAFKIPLCKKCSLLAFCGFD